MEYFKFCFNLELLDKNKDKYISKIKRKLCKNCFKFPTPGYRHIKNQTEIYCNDCIKI